MNTYWFKILVLLLELFFWKTVITIANFYIFPFKREFIIQPSAKCYPDQFSKFCIWTSSFLSTPICGMKI